MFYVLVSTVEREIQVQFFETYDAAYSEMKKQYESSLEMDEQEYDGYDVGIETWSAYSTTDQNYDWLITKYTTDKNN
jgi:hypothetical protein